MEKRYINESRYKKGTTRKRRDSSTVRSNLKTPKTITEKTVKQKQTKKTKKRIKRKRKQNKLVNIIICIILLGIIAVISRAILKDENEPFIQLPFVTVENDEVIKIGVITEDDLLDSNTSNVVINELNKYSKDMLLQINEDYSITYKSISSVTKISNKEYVISRNNKSKVTVINIKETIDNYRKNEKSVYYTKLNNIDNITVINEDSLNIKLKKDDPYFIYNLDICLKSSNDDTNYVQDTTSNKNRLIFNRHKHADKQLPSKIVVTKYKDMYSAVEAYKKQEINMFVTNAENVENILGKYEYNIKTYRNGKSVFLFGNAKSKVFSKEEVRKVIAYSIDRDSIIKDVLKSKGDKIDLPYIYDETKYKYDVYAAENILLTGGYTKSNKVYSKTEKGIKTTLELDLIVNKSDDVKVSIANKIKNNLGSVGIKVNVEKLTDTKIESRVKKGNYDLLLASVNLNNVPDISFVKNNLFITEEIENALINIEKSTMQNIDKNILSLQNALSQEISAIGIYSDVSYLIYSKDIIGIDNISYMNLFNGILS